MSNTARINLALVLLVAILGSLALLVPGPDHEETQTPLTPLDPLTIQRIRLQRTVGTLEFTRSSTGWRAVQGRADDDRLNALTRIAREPSLRRFNAHEAPAQELGLAPPQLVLELDGLRLEFGATEPIRQRRYVRIGDTIHLIEDRHRQQLLAPAASYLSKP